MLKKILLSLLAATSLHSAPPKITAITSGPNVDDLPLRQYTRLATGEWVPFGVFTHPAYYASVTFTTEPGGKYVLMIKRGKIDPTYCTPPPQTCHNEGWTGTNQPVTATGDEMTLSTGAPDEASFFRVLKIE